ncbi:hypothetical protein AMK59_700 [Oryctes borbonicus]|uniref:Centrosome-associated protein 350 n=1 Tax=Oryctes borbonicus TaxID=1629725 RepID=A0A0T6BCP6_9SCAR|nr:hypothetical protein AMK59_700 [Oryctes borbonicus]
MSAKSKKVDPNHVSQRVQQTKKEIEQLKLELQKLINRGIDSERANINTITVSENKNENQSHESRNIPSIPLQSSAQQSSYVLKKPPPTFIPKRDYSKDEKNSEVSPKKVKHYNVEEAREYMKRQKEKRMEKMKMQVQESQSVIDKRKEKLKELQKKSLELVQKNVNLKRDRSRSRDRKTLPETQISQNEIKPTNRNLETKKKNIGVIKGLEENAQRVPDVIVNNIKDIPSICLNKDHDIQTEYDSKNVNIDNLIKFNVLPKQYTDLHQRAAVKIQSYYRGYRQKKLYKKSLKSRKRRLNNIINIAKPVLNAEKPKEMEDPTKNNVPFWLQTAIQPYPYNFITAVRKKLNLATNTPIKTSSDIGIQISVEEPEKLQIKTKEEIKKAITDSIKETGSIASHKCLDLSLKNIKDLHLCKEKLHNSENDCDIKKHSENYFIKPPHSKPKHKKHVNLLDNEASESDTSKNIPDISSESTISTTHSKNPNEIDATSEYNLDINIDKLKNLKVRERKFDSLEDTMFLLSDNKYKEDKILLKQVPQISEYTENSTKHSATIQVNLGSSASLKSKPASKGSILQSKHSKSHESVRHHSASEQRKNKSDTNISNSNSIKSTTNNALSQKMSRSENHIVTDIDVNKLSKKSANMIPVKCSKSESNVSKLSEQMKSKKGFHSEIESDDNLKSFLEYMTSVEDSKKSRRSRSLQKKSTSQRNSNSFKTLPSKSEKISESTDNSTKTEKGSSLVENYSSNFSNSSATISSSVPLLQRPSVTLTTSERMELPVEEQNRNSISIRPGEVKCIESKTNTNQIHLKFEAELHLLNDFNESLRQFMAVEKSLFDLHGKNQQNTTIYQNQDTQTTIPLSPTILKKSDDTVDTESVRSQVSEKIISTINYRRGSDIMEVEEKTLDILEDFQQDSNLIENGQQEISNFTIKDEKSILTGLGLSQLNESMNSTMDVTASNVSVPDVSFNSNVYVGFSIGMFDQLIKDEDARIENLKTILKIREKALLDRTKGELAWLEIQKKQLIETGQLHEASLLKKKQRGIIIKLQHEKQEMQRLKQIQKAASKERKTILKEQRNMIKAQLSNNNQIPKIRRSVYKERRQLGPVKVYNLHRETINTETSISRRSSVAEEIIITSRSESIVGQISEEGAGDQDASMTLNTSFKGALNKRNEEAKKSLLMREAALQKRKKAAEELLQWHQRLLEEERKIAELEMAANTIIKQVPVHVGDSLCKSDDEKYDFKGTQLNFLWTNMTGRKEKKFKDEETYSLNQITLEKFCTDAKRNVTEDKHSSEKDEKSTTSISNNSSIKTIVDDLAKDKSDFRSNSLSRSTRIEDIKSSSDSTETEGGRSISNVDKSNQSHEITYSYTSEFDSPEIIDVEEENESNANKTNTEILVNEIDRSKSTLNEIMQNISNITDEISAIYKLSSVANTVKDESVLPTIQTENGNVKTEVTNNDIIRKDTDDTPQGDESEDDTLKSSAQSEIVKSLTELISSQDACQDIKSEQKHNIIETPESVRSKNTLTDSQGTLASNIELCTNSNKPKGDTNNVVTNDEGSVVSLHTDLNKELPREDVNNSIVSVQEEEEYTNSSKGNTAAVSTSKRSGDIINDLRKESDNRSVMTEMCSVNDTSNIIKNDIATSNEESQNNEISESISSKSENQHILDLSYGFTGVRTNVSETISSKTKTKSIEGKLDVLNELPLENGYYNVDVEIADDNIVESNENFVSKNDKLNENENQVKCVLETNIKNNSISDKLSIVNSIYSHDLNGDSNKSLDETTISTESGFEKSIHAEEKNYADLHEENSENNVEDILKTKLSSPVESSDLIINKNNNDKNLIDKSEIDEDNLEEIIEEKSSVDDIKHSVNESVDNSSESIDINDSINSASPKEIESIVNTEDEKNISDLSGKSSDNSEETSPKINRDKIVLNLEKLYDINVNLTKDNNESAVNVKKRVSEILADTSSVREDKSPRLQDIYTTTYDILSPEHSPDLESPANSERNIAVVTQLYDEEAEALFKKQLAIEQEIKQLEQQQKEHIPYIYMREIPNKPPPPYTPPSSQIHVTSVLASSVEQLQSMISIITDTLFKAYESVNLESTSPNTSEELKLLSRTNVDKECYEFVFDLCKEFAIEHYKQFVEQTGPSWMVVNQKLLIKQKPFDKDELNAYLFKKTKEILGFEKVVFKEKMITKWSRKKRDHVDEILVIESQAEESEWTNYDDDEMIVKNELTNDIMNMLLTETANVISKILNKKMNLS